MSDKHAIERKVAELRQSFDGSFALQQREASQEVEDLLAIRVAMHPYAIRLRDIAGLVTGKKLTSVPAAARGLLGLAGIRGGIVPVFGLSSVLGYAEAADSLRWMILCGAEDPIALAFSDFERYVRLPRTRLSPDAGLCAKRRHVVEVASLDDGIRAVISIPRVVSSIRNGVGRDRLEKEK